MNAPTAVPRLQAPTPSWPSALDPDYRVWRAQQDEAARDAGLPYKETPELKRQYRQMLDEQATAATTSVANIVSLSDWVAAKDPRGATGISG